MDRSLSTFAKQRAIWLYGGAGILLLAVLSAGIGPVAITPLQIFAILGDVVGLAFGVEFGHDHFMVLTAIRLPRVALAALVGASLAVAGALLQGLFRNPLASPMLIGTMSGAMLGAVLFIVIGAALLAFLPMPLRMIGLPLAAFIGGTSTTLLVYRLASANGRTSVGTMLLAGIAVNSLALAFTGFLITLADDAQLRNITFWNLGGLSGNGWQEVVIVGMALVPLAVLLPGLHTRLNALLLGEREARHLGVHVQRLTALCVGLSALAVGAAVSVSGNIQFVGLVVPNLMRLWLGPDHRLLVPGSACCGAGLMIAADLIARTATAPAELPVGIVTAAVGAPFFLWLLVRHRQAVFA